MISIIIASADPKLLAAVSLNIEETIGTNFEILGFPNGNAQYGICELYNTGAIRAKYDFLCFMHEDVVLNTQDWGRIVLKTFEEKPDLGLLGLAGSKYKTLAPSGFYCHDDMSRLNIIQEFKYGEVDSRINYNNPDQERFTEVVSVDGVWFCCPRSVAIAHPFDEQLLKGFHCYDIDFSLSVGTAFKVAVTYEVLLVHFSEGNYERNWVEQTLIVHKKWQHTFPISLVPLTRKVMITYEKNAFRFFLEKMKDSGFSRSEMLAVLWESKVQQKLGWRLYFKLRFYIYKITLL